MEINPIQQIDDNTEVPCPSSYVYSLQDVSAADSGRTEDVTMQKMRIGQIINLEIGWESVTVPECSRILQMFDPEYIMLTYLDAKLGDWTTAEFYVGNRVAPLFNMAMGLWESLSFSVIRRLGG